MDSFYNSYVTPLKGYTQYIIFDFNKKNSDPLSLIGISVDNDGEIMSGGHQNKHNEPVYDKYLFTENGINLPEDLFVKHLYTKEQLLTQYNVKQLLKFRHTRMSFTDEEIINYNLSLDERLELKLYDFIDVSEFDNYTTKEKLQLYYHHRIDKFRKLITDKELYALDPQYKLKQEYVGEIKLTDYLTEEQVDAMSLDDKVKYKVELSLEEEKQLNWNQKFEYQGHFTSEDRKQIRNLPFSEKLKIDNNIQEFIIIDEDNERNNLGYFEGDDNVNITLADDYINYRFGSVDELSDVLGIDETDLYDMVNDYINLDGTDDDENISNYLSEETKNALKNLMNHFGYEYGDIDEYGVIKKFFDEYGKFLKYESTRTPTSTDKVIFEFNFDLFIEDLTAMANDKFSENNRKVLKVLPYTLDVSSHVIELELDQKYIKKLINDGNDIDDLYDLFKSIDSINDYLSYYNDVYDKNDKDFEELHFKSFSDCMYESELDFANTLDKVLDYVKKTPTNNESYVKYENTLYRFKDFILIIK